MAYSGKYPVKNRGKYMGDASNVTYRSLWERTAFRWLDENSDVISWSSEETVIPYICGTDRQPHRYFVDLKFKLRNGETYLIEIKPQKEIDKPKVPKKKTQRFVLEVMTYVKNQSKWEAAKKYAEARGWKFQVWSEHTLRGLGMKIL
jgi:hypothetical protein